MLEIKNVPRNSVCKITFEDEVEHQATEVRCLVCYEQRDIGDSTHLKKYIFIRSCQIINV